MRKPYIYTVSSIALAFFVFFSLSGFIFTGSTTQQRTINLLENGSFEGGRVGLGLTETTGWKVLQGTIDIVPNAKGDLGDVWHQSADGSKSLELIGTPGAAVIQQEVKTEVGRKYVLTGWASHHPAVSAAGALIIVNGRLVDPLLSVGTVTRNDMKWEHFTREFEATSSTTVLLFADVNSAGNDFGGMVLDGLMLTTAKAERQPAPTRTPTPLAQPLCGLVQVKIEWKLPNVQSLPAPIAPAIGYWVKVGDRSYRTGENGIFSIREQTNQVKGYIYKEITDEHPLWEFPISSLTSNCNSPTPIIVELEVETLSQMDGQHLSLQFEPSHKEQSFLEKAIERSLTNTSQDECPLWLELVRDPISTYGKDFVLDRQKEIGAL